MPKTWSENPRIYEINTWVWLTTLSQQYDTAITLHNVPEEVLDHLASYHLDAIWMMGIWKRGTSTRASAMNYIDQYQGALPDIHDDDVVGSAYAIAAYTVEETLGGYDGLATFREQLARRGIKLIVDFIPNHTGLDHQWLLEHPEYYIQADPIWLQKAHNEFFEIKVAKSVKAVIAHGRDPYFPGWVDTAQLDAYSQGYRQAATETLHRIAEMADGVRCDMAMLMTNDVFRHTWGWLHPDMQTPDCEFWQAIIPPIQQAHPDFIFIAEAYWDMNQQLLDQGFNYTYDKIIYDRILSGDVNSVRQHLHADLTYLKHQIRFIENHDEPRANKTLGLAGSRAAAVLICTLPGATLLHDGQFLGRNIKLPVQIRRQPDEQLYPALAQFYQRLLTEVDQDIYRQGTWQMFPCYAACEGCVGDYNLMTYGWRLGDDCRLIVLNMSGEWSQGAIDLSAWLDMLRGQEWLVMNTLHHTYSHEDGDRIASDGLVVDLEPHQTMILRFEQLKHRRKRS